jgi:hypothetical protein
MANGVPATPGRYSMKPSHFPLRSPWFHASHLVSTALISNVVTSRTAAKPNPTAMSASLGDRRTETPWGQFGCDSTISSRAKRSWADRARRAPVPATEPG